MIKVLPKCLILGNLLQYAKSPMFVPLSPITLSYRSWDNETHYSYRLFLHKAQTKTFSLSHRACLWLCCWSVLRDIVLVFMWSCSAPVHYSSDKNGFMGRGRRLVETLCLVSWGVVLNLCHQMADICGRTSHHGSKICSPLN